MTVLYTPLENIITIIDDWKSSPDWPNTRAPVAVLLEQILNALAVPTETTVNLLKPTPHQTQNTSGRPEAPTTKWLRAIMQTDPSMPRRVLYHLWLNHYCTINGVEPLDPKRSFKYIYDRIKEDVTQDTDTDEE